MAHLRREQTGEGPAITVEQVAGAVCRELNEDSDEAVDRYVGRVRDALPELRRELSLLGGLE